MQSQGKRHREQRHPHRTTRWANGSFVALLLGIALGATGCLRPDAARPSYGSAMGAEGCEPREGHPRTYTVDWQGPEREKLSSTLSEGSYGAVVVYDCRRLTVLDSCKIGERYTYAGTGLSKDQALFKDADEIALAMPMHGAELAARVGAGSMLAAHLQIVGHFSVPKTAATLGDLWTPDRSAAGCAGATHYVRRATVGAFTLVSRADASHSANAGLQNFGGMSSSAGSAETVQNADGDPTMCHAAALSPDAAVPGCDRTMFIDLVPIGGPPIPDAIDLPSCPPGLVSSGGQCASIAKSGAYVCRFGNLSECQTQCARGSTESCNSLGFMHETGWGAGSSSADLAVQFYRMACDGGHQKACTNLALALLQCDGTSKDHPIQLLQHACSAGEARACTRLSEVTPVADGSDPAALENWASALIGRRVLPDTRSKLLRRGCRAGDPQACAALRAMGLAP